MLTIIDSYGCIDLLINVAIILNNLLIHGKVLSPWLLLAQHLLKEAIPHLVQKVIMKMKKKTVTFVTIKTP